MAEAERRITDVEYSQQRSSVQVDQIQRQLAQMQIQIGQLQKKKEKGLVPGPNR